MQNPKSKVKAFRLDTELVNGIRIAAKREELTENAFVQSVLWQRVKADPLIHAFPYVVLSRQSLVQILSTANPTMLDIVALDLGKKNFTFARELYESVGIEFSLLHFVVEVLDKQAHWFGTEGVDTKPERLILHHEYGMKWSVFLRNFLTGALMVISQDKMKATITDAYVSVELPKAL